MAHTSFIHNLSNLKPVKKKQRGKNGDCVLCVCSKHVPIIHIQSAKSSLNFALGKYKMKLPTKQ